MSDLHDCPPLLAADLAACRASLAHNSKTFHAASLLLPPAVRAPATVLYGFCRLADDTVDVEGGRRLAITQLRRRLDRVFEGRPQPVPADRALAAVVAQFAIPRALLDLLLEGLSWDVEGREYETLDDLQDYAARVAGTVGAMMSLLMGVRSPDALARACDLGVAMQLSNIARDVGEDAAMGRLYLPRQWLREAGLDPAAWLAAPRFCPSLAGVVQRLLDAADALYARAASGVASLPLACRPGINAARLLYAAVGHEVTRAGCDSVSRRAVVPRRRKQRLLFQAAISLWPAQARLHAPPLRANRPLLAAVAATPAAAPVRKVDFVIGLFDRLGRQDRQAGMGRSVA
ncbi:MULTISPECIES: phytoene/squalene synthase family protein [unclassified Roseateles]|uniref:phytoene/squalene synthase family protein n=1 Tax=unclassified Roseateles TaxID=2626991 RepID=UPI0006F66D21|nr:MULTISPECIES: phytoene/squalene synthase family protein [unclassified Roseateles]KQW42015.1 phytoene synthase [Pelomonas sp. Root405]KRA67618.1 phytoene synthase [Pelomonas sp. Root662]